MEPLERVIPKKQNGLEVFCNGSKPLAFNLLNFWQWSFSNIVDNTTRGILAEFLVAQAIGCVQELREEWAAYDLISPEGVTIEVKSAAYLQSWQQKIPSKIVFNCPKTHAWDADTNHLSEETQRQAQIYVFAVLAHQNKATINPLDVSQWEFYVVPTVMLDQRTRSQRSITLPSLQKLVGNPIRFNALREAVHVAAAYRQD